MGSHECGEIAKGFEFGERVETVRRTSPDGAKDAVEELAALRSGEAGLGGAPIGSAEAGSSEGLEGALGLMGENGGSALDFAGRERDAACVLEGLGQRFPWGGGFEFVRQRLRRADLLGNQARGAGIGILALARVAEADTRRGGEQAVSDRAGEFLVELCGGMRHPGCSLHIEREQWVRGTGCGPCALRGAEEPNAVSGEAGGLSRTGDLDRRVAGLGREEGLIQGLGENRKELSPAKAAAIEAQGRAGVNSLLPAPACLEFRAREGTKARPARSLKELRNEFGPLEWRFGALVVVSQAALGLRDAGDERGRQLCARGLRKK